MGGTFYTRYRINICHTRTLYAKTAASIKCNNLHCDVLLTRVISPYGCHRKHENDIHLSTKNPTYLPALSPCTAMGCCSVLFTSVETPENTKIPATCSAKTNICAKTTGLGADSLLLGAIWGVKNPQFRGCAKVAHKIRTFQKCGHFTFLPYLILYFFTFFRFFEYSLFTTDLVR
jgi:hypothetical protein